MITLSFFWLIAKIILGLLLVVFLFIIGCAIWLAWKIDHAERILHEDDDFNTGEL